jgi:pSer/pThr/pTyr-binding forkhead associated (FHA) protein
VRLDLPQVSRRHCCVALAYDRATIRDLGSRHGVRLNGRVIHEARLVEGDEVAIAHLIYRFEDRPAAVTAPPPPPKAEVAPPQPPSPPTEAEEESLSKLPVDFGELDLDDLYPIKD